jgi:predicted membrane protein
MQCELYIYILVLYTENNVFPFIKYKIYVNTNIPAGGFTVVSVVELVVVAWSVLVDVIDGVDFEPTVWSSTVEPVVVGWSVLVDLIDGVDIEPTVWSSTVELGVCWATVESVVDTVV